MSSTSLSRSSTGGDDAFSVGRTASSASITQAASSSPSTEHPLVWAGSIQPSMTDYCWSITQSTSTSDGVVRVSQTSTYMPCSSSSSTTTTTSSASSPVTSTSTQPSTTSHAPTPPSHPPAFYAYISVGAGAGVVLLTSVACYIWWYHVGRRREPSRKRRTKGGDMEGFSIGDPGSVSEVPTDPQVRSQLEELQLGQERIVQLVQAQLLEKMPGLDGITYRDWNKQVEEQHEIDEKKVEEARLAAIGGAYATTSRRIANAVVQQRIAKGVAASISQTKDYLDESGTQFLLQSEVGKRGDSTLFPDDSASAVDWIRSGQYEETNARFERDPRDPRLMNAAYANIHELQNPEQFENLVDEAVRRADQEHHQQLASPESSNRRQRDPQYYPGPSTSIRPPNQSPLPRSMQNPYIAPRVASVEGYQQRPRQSPHPATPRRDNSGSERLRSGSPTTHYLNEGPQYTPPSGPRTGNSRADVATPGQVRSSKRPMLSPLQTTLANASYSGQSDIRTGSSTGTPKRSPSLKKHHEVHTSTSDLVGPDGAIERHTTTHTYTKETTPVQENFPEDDLSSIGPIQFARSELSYPYSAHESTLTTDPFEPEVRQNYAQMRLERERAAEERRSREEERARWRRERDNLPSEYGERDASPIIRQSPVQRRVATPDTELEAESSARAEYSRSAQKRRAS